MIDKFLGAFIGVNPLYLALAAAAIAAVAGAAGFSAGWSVNGWRLGVQVQERETTIAMRDGRIREVELGLRTCGQRIETQNQAIAGWQAAAAEAGGKGDIARRAADEAAAKLQPDLVRLQALIGSRRPDGRPIDCGEAVAEIRKGLKP